MRTRLRAALVGVALALPLLAGLTTPASAATEWQNGTHDEDQLYDCNLERPVTGVSADVGWRPAGDRLPKVGERFYVRTYAGLVGLPCSGTVAVLPELIAPLGVEYAVDDDHPVRWALTLPGRTPQLSSQPLTFVEGVNGGVVVGTPQGTSWTLRQGYVLELQVPVVAERVLKGPATPQPECASRRDGTAPCPASQAGDHFQTAFTVGGHGGTKSYVTPYVALFATAATPPPPAPVASRTAASYAVSRTARGRAVVTVRSTKPVAGRVTVLDRGRRIGTAVLTTARAGRITVSLPRLARGRHVLTVSYAGSATVKASRSAARVVRVR